MQKAVLKLDMHDDKDKRKAMKIVSQFAVDAVDINLKDQKLTVTGDMDPVKVVGKLRKAFTAEIISVGPAKEAQKKDENKKDDNKGSKESKVDPGKVYPFPYPYYPPPPPYFYGGNISAEEDPNGCVIC